MDFISFCTRRFYIKANKTIFPILFLLIPSSTKHTQHHIHSLPVCLSAHLPVCLPVCLPAYLSTCLPLCPSVCLSVSLSLCLSVCLSVTLSVCLSAVCLSVHPSIHPSICLFVYLSYCLFVNLDSVPKDLPSLQGNSVERTL